MLTPHKSVIFTQLNDGEAVLLNMESKLYYSLNGSGSLLWRWIEGAEARDEAALTARLGSHFGLGEEAAKADVKEFVGDLLREGLLLETAAP